jgi:hypothetical protein
MLISGQDIQVEVPGESFIFPMENWELNGRKFAGFCASAASADTAEPQKWCFESSRLVMADPPVIKTDGKPDEQIADPHDPEKWCSGGLNDGHFWR